MDCLSVFSHVTNRYMQMTQAVTLTGLRKEFTTAAGSITAVAGIDLTIPTGQIVAILGPNGAGKSSTIDMMLGLATPTSGSVRVLGMTPRKALDRRKIAAVLQSGGLLGDFLVEEIIAYIAAQLGYTPAKAQLRVQAVIEQAHLTGLARRKVSHCSGGEQQRIRFALALLSDPEVLVLDEPTAAMDPQSRQDFWESMTELACGGRTIIFSTHYLQEAQDFAQRTVLIDQGKVVYDGPTSYLQQLVGDTCSSCGASPSLESAFFALTKAA